MNFNRYPAMKARGLITLRKQGAAYAADIVTFDHETGERGTPTTEALDLTVITAIHEQQKTHALAVKMLLDDLKAIP